MVKKVAKIFLLSWISFFLMTRVALPQGVGDALLTFLSTNASGEAIIVPNGFVSVHAGSKISKILGISEKLQEESEEESEEEPRDHSILKKKTETKVHYLWKDQFTPNLVAEATFESFQKSTLQTDFTPPIYLLHRVLII